MGDMKREQQISEENDNEAVRTEEKEEGPKNEENGQLLREISHEVRVTEQGDSMDVVIGRLFQKMRKQLFKEIPGPIIHMEAKEVYFENVKEEKRTEHFLLFFWPKERVSYTVTAKIVVDIEYLEIDKKYCKAS